MSWEKCVAIGCVAIGLLLLATNCELKQEQSVSQEEFGENWPLTVQSGTLACVWIPRGEASVIFISPDGEKYGLVGNALSSKKYSHIYSILKRNKIPKVLAAKGVSLCPINFFASSG